MYFSVTDKSNYFKIYRNITDIEHFPKNILEDSDLLCSLLVDVKR